MRANWLKHPLERSSGVKDVGGCSEDARFDSCPEIMQMPFPCPGKVFGAEVRHHEVLMDGRLRDGHVDPTEALRANHRLGRADKLRKMKLVPVVELALAAARRAGQHEKLVVLHSVSLFSHLGHGVSPPALSSVDLDPISSCTNRENRRLFGPRWTLVASDYLPSDDDTIQGFGVISRGVVRLLQAVEVMSSITPSVADFRILA
jgi:hypothetical protein